MAYGALKRPKDGIHKAVPGDTISSIAIAYGFTDWENKVWNAGENAKLKEERINPNTLVPGDQVFIPELEKKQESRPVDAWHDFHVVRNKRFLRLVLQDEIGDPIKNKKYEIEPDQSFRGVFVQQGQTTDADGKIEEEIPHSLIEADLVLPEDGLRVHLLIGHLLPLPMGDPIKAPASLSVSGLGDLAGAAGGLLDSAKGALGSAAGGLSGAASGALGGAASGGMSLSAGGSGGGAGGGMTGGFSGMASAAGGIGGQLSGAAAGAAKSLAQSASAMAGSIVKAVGGVLGEASLGSDDHDPNIYSAAQRLDSLGFDPGAPKNNKRSLQFSAAVMAFQTYCKDKGQLPQGAGGPLGGLTSPGGMLGGGGGMLGSIAGAVAGPVLAAVGLTGQLDKETIDALKKMHGC